MSVLKVSSLYKSYGKRRVLDNFSLEIDTSEFVSLLGPSGCGKTTALKIISGFIKPDFGSVSIENFDVSEVPPEKRNTAMCFQSYALFPHLTVKENIKFGLHEKKIPQVQANILFEEAISQLSLEKELSKYPNELSGGQQQRVALGRALVTRPKIILFDEPLSNLDAILRGSVRDEIKRVQSEFNLTAIYVTHDQSEALSISDRVVLMKDGKIEQVDTPENIYDSPSSYFSASFVGISNIHQINNINKINENQYYVDTNIGQLKIYCDKFFDTNNYISWRPENAIIEDKSSKSINGIVKSVAFQGSFTELEVGVGSDSIKIITQKRGLKKGQDISFSIHPADIHVINN